MLNRQSASPATAGGSETALPVESRPIRLPPSNSVRAPRIALIFQLQPNKNGSLEQWILCFCQAAAERGNHVDVFTLPNPLPSFLRQLVLTGARWYSVETLTQRPLSAIRRLSSYDVLHLNFVAVREPLALLAYLAYPARVILIDHISGQNDPHPVRFRWLRRCLDRVSVLRLSGIGAVSDYVRARNHRRFHRGTPIRRIYNGVDTTRFRPRTRPAGTGCLRLITASHLIRAKGIDVLLRALSLLESHRWHLTIVGDGPEQKNLRDLALELDLGGRVELLGLRNDLENLLCAADLFVHPARWQEAFGLAVAEAMACGLPIIASRVGAIPELVQDQVNGILVEPEQPAALAAAIAKLATNPALRLAMGRASRIRAVERFSIAECVANHLQWCEESRGAA